MGRGGSGSPLATTVAGIIDNNNISAVEATAGPLLPYSSSSSKLKALSRSPSSNRPHRTALMLGSRIRKLATSSLSPAAIKSRILLSFSVLLLSLLLFARSIAPLMGWHDYNQQNQPNNFRGAGYTVLINTWKRNELLKQTVAHYAACGYADAIHVVWSESDPPLDSLKAHLKRTLLSQSRRASKPSLRFELNEEDNLNNRFKPITEPQTDAVFSVDDDLTVPCRTLDHAFLVWRAAPSTMVGFVPRMHWLRREADGGSHYRYGGWWSVWWMGTYSMVLSKAAFLNRKYLHMYTYDMPSEIRDYVTRERNCEDIAMSLLVANASGAPPIWVKAKVNEIGSFGISSIKGHNERRNKCLNDFISFYGSPPLVETNVKVVDAQKEWLW